VTFAQAAIDDYDRQIAEQRAIINSAEKAEDKSAAQAELDR
jgi:hypothetical protein